MNIYDKIKIFLKEENFNFEENKEGDFLIIKLKAKNSLLNISIHYFKKKNILLCYSDLPLRIPYNKKTIIQDFLIQENNELVVTNFLMDVESGIVRLKSVIYGNEDNFDRNTFRNFFFTNWITLDTYIPKILSILSSKKTERSLIPETIILN